MFIKQYAVPFQDLRALTMGPWGSLFGAPFLPRALDTVKAHTLATFLTPHHHTSSNTIPTTTILPQPPLPPPPSFN